MNITPEELAEAEALDAKATKGPWDVRPEPYDDWGQIRGAPDAEGRRWTVAMARAGHVIRVEDEDRHRQNRTDPYAHNAAFIARSRTQYPRFAAALREAAKAEVATTRLLNEVLDRAEKAEAERDAANRRAERMREALIEKAIVIVDEVAKRVHAAKLGPLTTAAQARKQLRALAKEDGDA